MEMNFDNFKKENLLLVFAYRIDKLRANRGLSFQEISDRVGITVEEYFDFYERGEIGGKQLFALAREVGLGQELEQLATITDDELAEYVKGNEEALLDIPTRRERVPVPGEADPEDHPQ